MGAAFTFAPAAFTFAAGAFAFATAVFAFAADADLDAPAPGFPAGLTACFLLAMERLLAFAVWVAAMRR
jgi:hypothetical protein